VDFTNTVVIRRPPREVFRFLADLESIPKWNYAIIETRKTSQGPVGVGTTYRRAGRERADAISGPIAVKRRSTVGEGWIRPGAAASCGASPTARMW
jgi:uncharacterized protein YndB with AHSA1/START domain